MKKLRKPILLTVAGLALIALLYLGITALLPHKELYIPFQSKDNGSWGLISTSGKVLVSDFFPSQPSVPMEGIVRVGPDKDGMYSYYTVSKKPKRIGESYFSALFFSEGLAATSKPDNPIVYIDRKGRSVLTLKNDPDGKLIIRAGAFYHDRAPVMNEDGKWGFIDRSGKVVVPLQYDMVRNFRPGLAWISQHVFSDSGRVESQDGYLDPTGKTVLAPAPDTYYGPVNDGVLPFSRDHRKSWGLMTSGGKVILPPQANITNINPFNGGLGVFQNDNRKCGLLDRKGKTVLAPKYDYIINSGKILAVAEQGRWFFRDLKDREVMTRNFERTYPFAGKGALVRDKGAWEIVSKKGKKLNKVGIATVNTTALEDYYGRTLGISNPTIAGDFFSPEMVTRAVASEISSGKFNGIASDTRPEDLIKLMNADKRNYFCGTNNITFHNRRIGNLAAYTIEVVYDQNLALDSFGSPMAGAGGSPRITKIVYSLTLMGRKSEKAPEIAESLRAKIKEAGFVASQDPMSSGHWTVSPNPLEQWFSSPDGAAHAAVYQSSGFVTVTYRFWEKAE